MLKELNLYAVPKARLTLKARALLRQMLALEEGAGKGKGKEFTLPLVVIGDKAGIAATTSAGVDEFSACFYSFLALCKEGGNPRYYSYSFASAKDIEGAAATDGANSSAIVIIRREPAEVAYNFIDVRETPKRFLARESGAERERKSAERKEQKAKAEQKDKAEAEGKALQSAKNAVTRQTDALADKIGKARASLKADVYRLLKHSLADELNSFVKGAIGAFLDAEIKDEGLRRALGKELEGRKNYDFTAPLEKAAKDVASFIEDDYKMLESNVKTLPQSV